MPLLVVEDEPIRDIEETRAREHFWQTDDSADDDDAEKASRRINTFRGSLPDDLPLARQSDACWHDLLMGALRRACADTRSATLLAECVAELLRHDAVDVRGAASEAVGCLGSAAATTSASSVRYESGKLTLTSVVLGGMIPPRGSVP